MSLYCYTYHYKPAFSDCIKPLRPDWNDSSIHIQIVQVVLKRNGISYIHIVIFILCIQFYEC